MERQVVGIVLWGASIMVTFLRKQASRKIFKPRISSLWIYPIKSCGGIELKECNIRKRGLENDRMFMIIDKKNKFVSQRTHPKLALVKTRIDSNTGILEVTAPGMEALCVDLGYAADQPICVISSKTVKCTVWGDEVDAGVVAGGGLWFSRFLLGVDTEEFRLVRMAGKHTV
jgi:uncharacterized protein